MKNAVACFAVVAALFALPLLFAHRRAAAQPAAAVPALASLELSGPYVFRNLAIFAVHDHKAAKHEDILTLQEALAQKVVTIKETGRVNQLVASNRGGKSVYLQAGDIVKGGQQDRVLRHDTLLPPKSRGVPLAAFCVEAGRWHGRANEPVRRFASSSATIMTKRQKIAVKVRGEQGAVWDSVAAAQADMSRNVGHSVRSSASATSLQLSLEDKKLNGTVEEYVRSIEKQLPKDGNVVGYAVAVNGNVDSVEVFASPRLFGKMKGKLLKASASEAVSARSAKQGPPPTADAVRALITDAESGAARQEKQTLRTQVVRKETRKNVVFETNDPTVPSKAVHKSYLAK
ncbi:MAG: hypothetical protein JXP73_18870 [Deltaproteobacteria bacterium]|nr:hypothetical protein [Deltaproteobacteria bacterium]